MVGVLEIFFRIVHNEVLHKLVLWMKISMQQITISSPDFYESAQSI